MSRSHLFRIRHRHLNGKPVAAVHGGNHLLRLWSEAAQAVLAALLARPEAPNFQLIADHARAHHPDLLHQHAPKPSPRRRWERARIGEIWQHDSSIHPWRPADSMQTLLLTVNDPSRKHVAATFVPSDTTWGHSEHFRAVFLRMGLPMALYTDGLSLFGHESTAEGRDPKSEFQRVLTALGVSHLVVPSPQAKGKTERRFGPLQGRVVTLLGHEKVQSFAHAQAVLQPEIDALNRTVCRTTGMSPNDRRDRALQDGTTVMQPVPSTALLDLYPALHDRRRRNTDNPMDIEGRSWAIAPHPSQDREHHPPPGPSVLGRRRTPSAAREPVARGPWKVLPLTQSPFAPATSRILTTRLNCRGKTYLPGAQRHDRRGSHRPHIVLQACAWRRQWLFGGKPQKKEHQ